MKKSITGAVALLAGAFVAHSQGTVSFANLYVANPYIYVKLNGTTAVGGTAGHTGSPADVASGSDWTVELYGNAGSGDALNTLVPAILDGTASTPVTANLTANNNGAYVGTWLSSAIGDIAGTTGSAQPATVAVAAWYNNGGTITSITAAQAGGFANGFSGTGNVTTGGVPVGGGPSATAPTLPTLGNISVVGNVGTTPEPSTIALGVMGAGAFLARLRKKQ